MRIHSFLPSLPETQLWLGECSGLNLSCFSKLGPPRVNPKAIPEAEPQISHNDNSLGSLLIGFGTLLCLMLGSTAVFCAGRSPTTSEEFPCAPGV